MSDVHSGTAAGMFEFLAWAGKKGELPEARVKNLTVAANRILAIEDEPDKVDIRTLDVEALLERFEILNRVKYNSSSMMTYQGRFRNLVEMYRAFLDGGTGWKSVRPLTLKKAPSSSNGARSGKRLLRKPPSARTELPASGPTSPAPDPAAFSARDMITYDYPLRPNLIVRLTLPVELTAGDAARIAAFVKSLAFVKPSQPAAPGDQEQESEG